ncbi:Putative disease resistance protein RGA3 [Triticum urartu]|uniref:Putative disease resistance protein RGA3 n=1 Tax=Triticum urartu TaxID=4572 RepID=M8A0G1_TRIUA|nr:Putative disease resistance protein RGA3 [Triticum urartu]
MDAVEDTMLEAAIGWLADTILANLPDGGKLDSWIRQAGLGNDIGKLKAEVEAVEMVSSAVQGRAAGNKPLARSLAAVKELLYDADDAVDELDCYRLQQHQLQPGYGPRYGINLKSHLFLNKPEGLRLREQDASAAKQSLCAEPRMGHQFCANISSPKVVATNVEQLTLLQAGNLSSRKRMRIDQESTHITAANPNGWSKGAFSERIQDITSQLQGKHGAITRLLKILGPDSGVASSNHHCHITISDARRRTSALVQGKVYGRAQERGSIKTLIKKHRSTEGVTVLPIVGIGGVGKTTLAQLVYNDPALESQFDHKIWIWVSSNFNEMRLTREMLDYVSHETHDGLCSFPKLQEVLKGHFKSKRVLLILDDVWEAMDDGRWKKLLAPFNSNGAAGNMIILTTRKPSIAKRRGTTGPINLHGLDNDDFWLLFKACAFGDENYKEQASLSDLGHEIAKKLKGNPLAAQTAGALLKDHLTVDHWSNILKTEGWKSLQHTGGIMSSLKLSYDELPYLMQQCCSYCSIFPYGYEFHAEELVHLWISQGFVKSDHSSNSLEEMGRYYLIYLVNPGLFEEVEGRTCYVMCSLIYDFARLVSRTECAALDGLQCSGILPTIHHLSIVTNSIYQRDHQTGNIPRNESLANPTHLRYLKIQDGHTEQKASPHILSKVFHLQVLDVTFFKPLHTVLLEDCGELRISLEMLRFLKRLKLSNMQRVSEVSIPSLEELVLDGMPDLQTCSCTSVGDMKSSLRVLEIRRCPLLEVFDLFQKGGNYGIEHKSWLPSLRKLIVCDCPRLQVHTALPPSATFSELSINEVSTIMAMEGSSMEKLKISGDKLLCDTLDDKILAFHNLKDIKYLEILNCKSLTSISFKGLSQLISLKSFKIVHCKELFSLDDVLEQTHDNMIIANEDVLTALESLDIIRCGITGKWLSLMLRHSPTLKELYLYDCPQLKQLKIEEEGNVQPNLLPAFEASSSGSLVTLEGLRSLVKLKHLLILKSSALGLGSLVNLKHLEILDSPALDSLTALESTEPAGGISSHSHELFPALESLAIDDLSPLNMSFCKGLTCLRSLRLVYPDARRLTDEQERALLLLSSLQKLGFYACKGLVHLPAGLGGLPSMKKLEIRWCKQISGLPNAGLPPSLEKLMIRYCSVELSEQCRSLATSKLEVKIDGDYVN